MAALFWTAVIAEAAIPLILKEARNTVPIITLPMILRVFMHSPVRPTTPSKWLRTTTDTGMPNYSLLARDPHLDRIRKETAFIQLMAELKPRWEVLRKEFE